MIEKVFGLIFILFALFIGKMYFFPQPDPKHNKNIIQNNKKSIVAKISSNGSHDEDGTMTEKILSDLEQIQEIQFAKNKINFIDVKSEESNELKVEVKKIFAKYFSVIQTAPYYLEIEIFQNPEAVEMDPKKKIDEKSSSLTHQMILQCSILDRVKNNKLAEFGIKVEL